MSRVSMVYIKKKINVYTTNLSSLQEDLPFLLLLFLLFQLIQLLKKLELTSDIADLLTSLIFLMKQKMEEKMERHNIEPSSL